MWINSKKRVFFIGELAVFLLSLVIFTTFLTIHCLSTLWGLTLQNVRVTISLHLRRAELNLAKLDNPHLVYC